MTDYRTWKESQLTVTNLLLDPQNPRIPDSSETLSQRHLLADLVENDKVYDLAKGILDNGYYPVEALIYIEEKGKKYVVEGNRRLAALKLLLSPEMAPSPSWERRFRALSNRIDPNTIRKIKVIKAPSRDAAAPVIMSKHTRNQVESWGPLMQAKFYRNLVDSGLTIEDICGQYNLQNSEVTDALQRHSMYSIACMLNLPDEIAKIVQNPREFPVTNLERLYKNPKVDKFIGISFNERKELVGSVDVNEFKKAYAKIVTDIATGTIHSRNVNTTAEMDEYLNSFGEQRPDLKKKGIFTAEDIVMATPKRKATKKSSSSNLTPKPKPISKSIIPSAFSCDVNNQRINDIFNEIKSLNVAKYPNAAALMFRSLLEMSLGYYLDKSGHLDNLLGKIHDKKKQNSNDRHPLLTDMLKYVVDEKTGVIRNPNIRGALQKLISQKEKFLSIDTLNFFVHNQYYCPNEEELRKFWPPLQGLFEIILVEPNGDGE